MTYKKENEIDPPKTLATAALDPGDADDPYREWLGGPVGHAIVGPQFCGRASSLRKIFSTHPCEARMNRCLQLTLIADPKPDPNIAWLEQFLLGSACWVTAKEIQLTTLGRMYDRDIRDLASSSRKIISGQKGYKHIQHSSPEEINHACSWMESQAKKMATRAAALRAEAHKIFGK